jgi:hypothetical protein
MAVFAHYDRSGSIHSLVSVKVPKGVGLMPGRKAGLSVSEIEGLTLSSPAELREIAKSHKVSTPGPRCTLSRC